MQKAERDWRALQVAGPLAFDAIGVLVSFIQPLADIGLPVLTVATYDTDYIFVRNSGLAEAQRALGAAGHTCIEQTETEF